MTSHRTMDQLFERLLPSASAEQVESARGRILGRVRSDVAAGREAVEAFAGPLNHGDYHILLVLEDGERHGYAIISEVGAVTEGATRFGPGTLYTSIKRLLTAGLIEEARNRPDLKINDEPRRYYRLTGMGQKILAAESQRLAARLRYAHAPQIERSL